MFWFTIKIAFGLSLWHQDHTTRLRRMQPNFLDSETWLPCLPGIFFAARLTAIDVIYMRKYLTESVAYFKACATCCFMKRSLISFRAVSLNALLRLKQKRSFFLQLCFNNVLYIPPCLQQSTNGGNAPFPFLFLLYHGTFIRRMSRYLR